MRSNGRRRPSDRARRCAGASATSLLDAVRSEVCRQVNPFVRCENLKIDIGVYDSFTRIDRTSPIDPASGTWRANFGTQHGCLTKGSVVVVQAAFAQHTHGFADVGGDQPGGDVQPVVAQAGDPRREEAQRQRVRGGYLQHLALLALDVVQMAHHFAELFDHIARTDQE